MADDLGEAWWKEEKVGESPSDNDGNSDNGPEAENAVMDTAETPTQSAEPKKKKKRIRKRRRITDELKEKGDKPSTPEDFIAYLKKQFEGKLSSVELDEIELDTDKHMYSANTSPGFSVAYLRTLLPKWKKLKAGHQSEGSPMLLVLCPSAMRAVDLNRQLQEFKGENCKCAKLFAKHMKLEEQQKFLKKSVCHIGIGTPNRVFTLIKSGHLKLEKLLTIVLDWNWRDVKHRRLVDVPELRTELATLLHTFLIPNMKSHLKCKIGIL